MLGFEPMERAMLHKPSLVLAFLAAFAGLPAHAFIVPLRTEPPLLEQLRYCGDSYLNTAGSDEDAQAVATLLASGGPRIAVRTCVDSGYHKINTHFHVRYVETRRNGMCRMREREIFRAGAWEMLEITPASGPPLLLRGWRLNPTDNWAAHRYQPTSREFALVTDGPCPPPGDSRYVHLDNVSDARLAQVANYWRKIAASPETFHAALEAVRFEDAGYLAWRRIGAARLLSDFTDAVFQHQAAPAGLSCKDDICTLDIAWWNPRFPDRSKLFGRALRFIELRVTPDAVIPIRQGSYLRA
jgi:hypothetical protein